MQIGFNAPTSGLLAEPDNLARLCAEAEKLGYDYAAFSDHVVMPTDIHAKYPYSETGEFPANSRAGRHEQLTEIAFVAAVTKKLRFVTSVMVVPHRPAVLTAKILATIDVLSKGRLTLGIGAGWLKEEFEALEVPDFAARGRVTDEYIAAFKVLWTQAEPSFAGEFVRFSGITMEPKPPQTPHPPIWVGGESGPAVRRAAKLGDAWYPIGTNPSHPLDSLPRYQGGIARLHKAAAAIGRDPKSVGLSYRVARHGAALAATADDGERRLFSGASAEIAADLRALKGLGVASVDFSFAGATVDEVLATMAQFRTETLAKV
jgi:probable F420-dependent oxidoreductase